MDSNNSSGSFAVTILGAGRSGTSVVSRTLPALGVELGNNLRAGRGKNPTGFFEDRDLLALNQRLKRALGIRGDSVRLITEEEWQAPSVLAIRDEAIETIKRRFGDSKSWGYKYGRTLRMMPFWLDVYEALKLDVRYIVALRNPKSVARSRQALDADRGTQEKSDLEWLVNVVPYLDLVRDRPVAVIDYDLLIADPTAQIERLASHLNIGLESQAGIHEYANNFLKPGMRHSRFTINDLEEDERIHPLVRQAYSLLFAVADDKAAIKDPDLWHQWNVIKEQVLALAPPLRHIDAVQASLRSAQMNPIGPLQILPDLWRRLRGK